MGKWLLRGPQRIKVKGDIPMTQDCNESGLPLERGPGHAPPNLRIDLPVVLPGVLDAQDACVERTIELLSGRQGITDVHLTPEDGAPAAICLHYDPDLISLARVERLALAAGSQVSEQYGHALLRLRAITGEDGARRIEDGLKAVDGVSSVSVNLAAQEARVEFDRTQTSEDEIRRVVQAMGHAPQEPGGDKAGHDHAAEGGGWYARNQELAWSLIAGALLLIAWVGQRWFGLPGVVARVLFVASYVFGGYDLARHAFGTIRQRRFTFDIDLLMLLAAIGAAILGEWFEGALLLFLFSLAHALEHYALGRARHAIEALAELAPPVARVMRGGREVEVPVEQVAVGDVVVVRPGDRLPTGGRVRTGRSAVNQAPITGESLPVEKEPGSDVFAGTVNGDGVLEVETTHAAGDRTLDRVVQLVEEAQTQKAPTQRFTDRLERIFVPVVLIADVVLIILPPLLGWLTWNESFYRGMALLVAASPCALALGTPSAVLAGIAQAAR